MQHVISYINEKVFKITSDKQMTTKFPSCGPLPLDMQWVPRLSPKMPSCRTPLKLWQNSHGVLELGISVGNTWPLGCCVLCGGWGRDLYSQTCLQTNSSALSTQEVNSKASSPLRNESLFLFFFFYNFFFQCACVNVYSCWWWLHPLVWVLGTEAGSSGRAVEILTLSHLSRPWNTNL